MKRRAALMIAWWFYESSLVKSKHMTLMRLVVMSFCQSNENKQPAVPRVLWVSLAQNCLRNHFKLVRLLISCAAIVSFIFIGCSFRNQGKLISSAFLPLKVILLSPLNDYHLIFHYACSLTIWNHHEHCSYLISASRSPLPPARKKRKEEEMMRFCVCDEHRQDGIHNRVNNEDEKMIMKRWESFSIRFTDRSHRSSP